jgi:hypothetical protein
MCAFHVDYPLWGVAPITGFAIRIQQKNIGSGDKALAYKEHVWNIKGTKEEYGPLGNKLFIHRVIHIELGNEVVKLDRI